MIKRNISFTQSQFDAVLAEAQSDKSNFGDVIRRIVDRWMTQNEHAALVRQSHEATSRIVVNANIRDKALPGMMDYREDGK
jgi:hypothetical protein